VIPEPHHTAADIETARALIKADRDVVGTVRVGSIV
jgi:hypothetical protein